MTRPLFRALFGRVVVALLAAAMLGGLATQAAASRPAPYQAPTWHWTVG